MDSLATREGGKPVYLDIKKILAGRMLIQANSGGGKSYAVRKIAEVTYGKVQQIIIDVEGEFASLRDKYDYLLIAKDGDIPINLRSAELLATRLLELNVSAIIDLYELKHHERIRFVKLFLDSMINAPKNLWHDVEVILDEAHIFAPEKGEGDAESKESVKDMATRGRKRGFALIAATQRLSKLDKNVAAELNTKLIGRSSLDVDMKRAAFELGFTSKEDIFSLRSLEQGEFFAFGPALSNQIVRVRIDKVTTKHADTSSTYTQKPAEPTEKIKKLLAKLADLPQEAEKELKTKQDLERKIIELNSELRSIRTTQTKIDPNALQESYNKGLQIGQRQAQKLLEDKFLQKFRAVQNTIRLLKVNFENKKRNDEGLQKHFEDLASIDFTLDIKPEYVFPTIIGPTSTFNRSTQVTTDVPFVREVLSEIATPKGGAMRILQACAMSYPNQMRRSTALLFANLSPNSGSTATYISELKVKGLIEINNEFFKCTDAGKQIAGDVQSVPNTHDELLRMWTQKLSGKSKNMLEALCKVYPDSMTKEQLATEIGLAHEGNKLSGTGETYLSTLRTNGLVIDTTEGIKASNDLFPDRIIA